MIEAAWHALLTSMPTITNLVGTRIYPDKMPDDVQLPCITYAVVSTIDHEGHDGRVQLGRVRVQSNCWGSDPDEAANLRDVLKVAVGGYRGTPAGSPHMIDGVKFDNAISDPQDELRYSRQIVDHMVTYKD